MSASREEVTRHREVGEGFRPVSESRREMIAKAVDGVARFKKSRLSVLLLKGSMAMAQVVTLVTLLILSSLIPSPIGDGNSQAKASEQCPHPELFQCWMAINAFRLALCWGVSCWMLVREERRTDSENEESSPSMPRLNSTSQERSTQSNNIGNVLRREISPPETILDTPLSAGPPDVQDPHVVGPHEKWSPNSTSERNRFEKDFVAGGRECQEARETDGLEGRDRLADHACDRRPGNRASQLITERTPRLEYGTSVTGSRPVVVASALDKLGPRISKCLGVLSAVLFVLGNVLAFYNPNPGVGSCYDAAPLLWWGVMGVTAVGWFLILQIVVVAFGIGIGGPFALTLFRRLGVIPPPPVTASPRAPPSDPLLPAELSQISIVAYIPHQSDSLTALPILASNASVRVGTVVEELGVTNPNPNAKSPHFPHAWEDISRLPYPPHPLKPHQSTCVICQDVFAPPADTRRTVLLSVTRLRLLGCGHVYHMECVDRWLTTGSGNCPTCNRSVRDWFPL